MENRSLGKTILEKFDRLIGEEAEKQDTQEPIKNDLPDEVSETLKKLQGHLLRFQEQKENSTKKAVGAGAVGGAVAGRQLARFAHGETSGANAAIKATKAGAKEAAKNQAHFGAKALAQNAKAKVAKVTGNLDKAKALTQSAQASANAASKAGKTVNAANKTVKGLKATMNAAGRAGGWKGAAIGAGAAFLGKKAYDKFKKN